MAAEVSLRSSRPWLDVVMWREMAVSSECRCYIQVRSPNCWGGALQSFGPQLQQIVRLEVKTQNKLDSLSGLLRMSPCCRPGKALLLCWAVHVRFLTFGAMDSMEDSLLPTCSNLLKMRSKSAQKRDYDDDHASYGCTQGLKDMLKSCISGWGHRDPTRWI